MTDIPADVMKEAAKYAECYEDPRGCVHVGDDSCGDVCAIKVMIARAILAERGRWEHVEEVLFDIEQWCRAYPLKVFPEPDFTRAAELLKAGGMNLDAISASNMRHVLTRVEGMIAAIRSQP